MDGFGPPRLELGWDLFCGVGEEGAQELRGSRDRDLEGGSGVWAGDGSPLESQAWPGCPQRLQWDNPTGKKDPAQALKTIVGSG